MALSKVNYVDNQTIITAQNLNNIQNEIIQNAELIKKAAPRNLLDNSDFRNPVNQRGQDSYSLGNWGGYTIDRWAAYSNGIDLALTENGISFSKGIYQRISKDTAAVYNGKKLTFSAKIGDIIYICSGIITQTGSWHIAAECINGSSKIRMEVENTNDMMLIFENSSAATVEWAALYEGEYTLDTLPEYQPKGYMVEALNCGALHVTTTATLNEGQWSNSAPFEQSIVIPGIIESDVPHITPVYSTTNTTAIAQKEAWACVSNAIAENGVIRFICFEDKPTTTIPIQIEVNR